LCDSIELPDELALWRRIHMFDWH